MRKTYDYWVLKQTNYLAKLQAILNHVQPEITFRYIKIRGINRK
ncbi:hypothetical protein ACWE42_11190 [Sutcliffiella cohnii]